MKLEHIRSSQGYFLLLDFANWPQWLSALQLPEDAEISVVEKKFQEIANIVLSDTTGLLLSPTVGWDLLHDKPADCGVVFSLEEQQSAVDPLVIPLLETPWGIEYVRNNYGVATLTIDYHPAEAEAVHKRQLIAELADYAAYEHIDFILELRVKNHTDRVKTLAEMQEAQLQAVKQLQSYTSLFILESPEDPLAIATITAELDRPWLVRPRGKTYQQLKDTVRLCTENGAVGAILDQSLILDIESKTLADEALFKSEGTAIIRDRVVELKRIIGENISEVRS